MTLPPGISEEPGRGFVVEVRVRPLPKRRKRFPRDTPLAVMEAWREDQLAELAVERKAVPTAPVVAPVVGPQRRVVGRFVGTLRGDVETYLTDKLRPSMDPHNKLQARRYLRTLARTDLGRYPRQAITATQLETVLAQWERTGVPASVEPEGRKRIVPPGPLAPDTVNKIRGYWIGFYKAMNLGLGLPNPARDVPRRTPGAIQSRSIPFALAVKITDHIGKSGKPTKTAARLTLMCVLGVRPCEIKKIKPAKHWNQQERTLFVQTGKGGKPRTLPLDDRATEALDTLDRLKGWGDFSAAPAARMFHEAVKAAKLSHLEPIVPYDLRHCFGTEAYRKTGDLKAVAEAMGHRNLKMTERYVEGAVSEKVTELFKGITASTPVSTRTKKARKRGGLRAV